MPGQLCWYRRTSASREKLLLVPSIRFSSSRKYCASGADKFYEVKQANQTLSVFNSIGQSLAKLRIAK